MSRKSAFWILLASGLGSASKCPASFAVPKSDAVDHVNALIGNGGDTPNGSGGMIPSTAPPFAMTRWVAQTHENYVEPISQPFGWGESGQVVVVPGIGDVKSRFEDRALGFSNATEVITPSYYRVDLDAGNGDAILAEQSATSRVGHLRFTFSNGQSAYVLLEATRPTVITSTPTNITYPLGSIAIDPVRHEITGSNSERQDWIITPTSTASSASHFKGYFCARFDAPFAEWGVVQNRSMAASATAGNGSLLSGYARFPAGTRTVNVRVGVSFISIDQARRNLDNEIPDGVPLEETARRTRTAWAEKLDRITLEGASEADKEVFYTAFFHSLQYPYEQDEDGRYYSGYDNQVHKGQSYTGYSIWDTFRAEWAWLILLAPERVPAMVTSMLQDYQQGGWLPMWKNIVETNIMVGTHADSLIAEAVVKGVKGFDTDLAWEAAYKDGVVPPENDWNTTYSDREEASNSRSSRLHVCNSGTLRTWDMKCVQGCRPCMQKKDGLQTTYTPNRHPARSTTLASISFSVLVQQLTREPPTDDDYALYRLAAALKKPANIVAMLHDRAMNAPFTLFNNATGFMEARNADGSWAGPDAGWTEGDKWAYTFDVVHDVPALALRRGGNASFVQSLDDHFDGGHNDHSNEPSHHIPYLYALAGAASKTQERVREIAKANYNNTPVGLSGNEDCGQMSAWYLFSVLGFYPVNPASGEYVVGSPFFDKVTLKVPGHTKPLTITAAGAPSAKYVRGLTIDGKAVGSPIISHEWIAAGADVRFEMREVPQTWGGTVVGGDEQDDENSKDDGTLCFPSWLMLVMRRTPLVCWERPSSMSYGRS
ncbi:Glycoside hydrolase family 92 protein [Mycena venus]|uniref:Glycoside hydrolase family 92 protein n=1 Tax=Mycena venus TaxID=2733690 RepID=A0A8H6X2G3_9AGAR|nr:Glycoside hydrolase family 92 protein [Mycena venus]